MFDLEWANFAVSAGAFIAAGAAAYFAGAGYRRDARQAKMQDARAWFLHFDVNAVAQAPRAPEWKPFIVLRERAAAPVRIQRVELLRPWGARIAPSVKNPQARGGDEIWIPKIDGAGSAFDHRTRDDVDYQLRLFVDWPSASRFRKSSRLEIRLIVEEVSAMRRKTKIVVKSESMPLNSSRALVKS